MINGYHHLGKFIAVEGIDGSGKTSALETIKNYLVAKNIKVVLTCEPGATSLGENLRSLLLHSDISITPQAATLLHYASRCQHLQEFVLNALNNNYWVISDRFEDSTFAYQGAEGVNLEFIKVLSALVLGNFKPDLTLYLDLPIEVGLNRISGKKDNYESKDIEFFKQVQTIYKYRMTQPHCKTINANRHQHEVRADILHHVEKLYFKAIKNVH